MKTPKYWYRAPGLVCRLLSPLGYLVGKISQRCTKRAKGKGYRAPVPVICVGNIVAGGGGKTPCVCSIVQALLDMGKNPHILSRGYGGTLKGPLRLDCAHHTAAEVGDEALLLSAFAPVWIGADRAASAKAAAEAGADCLVMDDGFQNYSLEKDLSFIAVNGALGFGNEHIIPAGPLRERISLGLQRADSIILIGRPTSSKLLQHFSHMPVLHAKLIPLETGMTWAGLRCVAFAGIAHPEKFFMTLQSQGAQVIRTHALGDHQTVRPALFQRMLREAEQNDAQLVTTEKDAMRLPVALRRQVLTLPVRLVFSDAVALNARLAGLFEG